MEVTDRILLYLITFSIVCFGFTINKTNEKFNELEMEFDKVVSEVRQYREDMNPHKYEKVIKKLFKDKYEY